MTGRCAGFGMSPSRHAWCLDRRSRSLTGLELRPRSPHLALLVVAFVVAGLGLLSSPASAHSGKQSYLYLSIFDDGVEGRVEIPAVDLGPAIGVDLVGFPGGLAAGVAAERAAIDRYVAEHLSLADEDGPWSIDYGRLRVLATENGPYVVLPYVIDQDFDTAPRVFTVGFDVIIESNPEKDALLIVEDDWRGAVFDNGSEPLIGFSTGLTVQEVDLDDAGTLSSMVAIRGLGSDAVRNGIDMMLVVAALVLPIVLLPAGRSRSEIATTGELAGRAGRMFAPFAVTVAVGSLVAGLGVIDLPDRLVGVAVAIMLGALALYSGVARYRPAVRAADVWLAALAGLAVGMELGRVFIFYGLDRSRPLTGWIAFLLGALIAMALIAVFVGLPLYLLRRTRFATGVLIVLAVVLGGYALAWTGERLLDTDWPIEEVANPFRVWPRNAWFVALAIALAAMVRAIESRAGRLRSVGSDATETVAPAAESVAVG